MNASLALELREQRESAFLVWGRRAITIPVWSVLAVLLSVLLPIWLPMALAVDLLLDGRRLPRTRALTFFLVYFLCELLGIVAAGAVWLVLLGGALGGPKRFVEANAALQRLWSDALLRGVMGVYGMRLTVEGGTLGRPAPFLLFVRHSSTADTVIAAATVANPNRVLLKYVLKKELLWDPCLDIVGRRLPNAFVDRSGTRAEDQAALVARLAIGLDARTGVLIYPEGTRFSAAKLVTAVAHLRERGQSALAGIAGEFRSVLPPRLGGALSLLNAAPGVDVIFLDQVGFEGAESLAAFWGGALVGRTISVRLRRIRAADIPATGRDRWLFEQWRETDRWVTGHLVPGR